MRQPMIALLFNDRINPAMSIGPPMTGSNFISRNIRRGRGHFARYVAMASVYPF